MSEIISAKNITPEFRDSLRDLANKATQVVGWYAHPRQVRGPFNRWFNCDEVAESYRHNVANVKDDCEYCAAAMNSVPALLDVLDEKDAKIKELERTIERQMDLVNELSDTIDTLVEEVAHLRGSGLP